MPLWCVSGSNHMAHLLNERDLGALTIVMSLLVALVSNNHDSYWSCVPKCECFKETCKNPIHSTGIYLLWNPMSMVAGLIPKPIYYYLSLMNKMCKIFANIVLNTDLFISYGYLKFNIFWVMTGLSYTTELISTLWNYMKWCHLSQRWPSMEALEKKFISEPWIKKKSFVNPNHIT